jgi:hypothetical protein
MQENNKKSAAHSPRNTTKQINENTEYIIPIEGSLSLFALGAQGLLAWRKMKEEHLKNDSHFENTNHL